MKKLCYITTISMTLDAFVLESAKYIHENTGWDITFVCDFDEFFQTKLPDYIHYHPIRMSRGISLNGISAMLQMMKLFKTEKFDMIQYSTPNASLYASMAGKLARVPVRLYCQWGMAYVGFNGRKRQIFKMIEKLVCRLSTWIEPDSKSNLEFSHKERLYSENKSSVIWNGSACGVNLGKFNVERKEEYRRLIREKHDIPADAFVFGYVGRITRDKGVNELLHATQLLIGNNSKIYLLMVGPEEVDDTVDQTLFQWSKESHQVRYVGRTENVEQYMAAMDCYVLPSYREGFGMTVVEAEAMAVPVIITNIPGPVDGMERDVTGYVVEKKNSIELLNAMKKMIQSKELNMGDNGLNLVKTKFEQTQLFEYILSDRKRLMETS